MVFKYIFELILMKIKIVFNLILVRSEKKGVRHSFGGGSSGYFVLEHAHERITPFPDEFIILHLYKYNLKIK